MSEKEKWQEAEEFDDTSESFNGSGRKANQRLKALFVLNYLQNNSDDENFVAVEDVIGYLNDLEIADERAELILRKASTRSELMQKITKTIVSHNTLRLLADYIIA